MEKFAKSIDEKTTIAFQKVKEDILFLNNRIEILDKTLNKHAKNSSIHLDKSMLNIIEDLIKRVESLENENKSLKKSSKKTNTVDDLTKVEGIGPVISKALHKEEIFTFSKLAKTSIKGLKEILEKNNLQQHDPTTWPKQAKLAANNEWAKLDIWQEELKGGRL